MKTFDYHGAYITDTPLTLCNEHFPVEIRHTNGTLDRIVTLESDEVCPIFADAESDSYPVCDVCGHVFDYINLTEDGIRDTLESLEFNATYEGNSLEHREEMALQLEDFKRRYGLE